MPRPVAFYNRRTGVWKGIRKMSSSDIDAFLRQNRDYELRNFSEFSNSLQSAVRKRKRRRARERLRGASSGAPESRRAARRSHSQRDGGSRHRSEGRRSHSHSDRGSRRDGRRSRSASRSISANSFISADSDVLAEIQALRFDDRELDMVQAFMNDGTWERVPTFETPFSLLLWSMQYDDVDM